MIHITTAEADPDADDVAVHLPIVVDTYREAIGARSGSVKVLHLATAWSSPVVRAVVDGW
jgi:hypothetical protein